MPQPVPPPSPSLSQTPGAGSFERLAPRIAALVIAAPLVWCGVGVAVVSLLHRRMAGFAARYAALHAVPWPPQRNAQGKVQLFLHVTQGQREVFFSNPESWRNVIAVISFLLVPALLVMLGVVAVMLWLRRWLRAAGAMVVFLGWSFMSIPFLPHLSVGRELALDLPSDSLLLNGVRVAPLSEVARFGAEMGRTRSGSPIVVGLQAELRNGGASDLSGGYREDVEDVLPSFNAILGRLLGVPVLPAPRFCPAPGCPGWQDAPPSVQDAVGAVLGAQPRQRAP